jgi:hypothetical protein
MKVPQHSQEPEKSPESIEAIRQARENYEAMLRQHLAQKPASSLAMVVRGRGKNARLVLRRERNAGVLTNLPAGLKEAQAVLINTYNHSAISGTRISHHDLATDPNEHVLHHDDHHEHDHDHHHEEHAHDRHPHEEPHHTAGHDFCKEVEHEVARALLHEHHEREQHALHRLGIEQHEGGRGFAHNHSHHNN